MAESDFVFRNHSHRHRRKCPAAWRSPGVVSEFKPELAEGWFHEAQGGVIFMIALAILVAFSSVPCTHFHFHRETAGMSSLLHSKFVYGLTLVLVVQAVLFYSASHGENTPLPAPMNTFPITIGPWSMVKEGVVDQENAGRSARGPT